jgi:phosphoglycerate dehydrogenase-like enzyme
MPNTVVVAADVDAAFFELARKDDRLVVIHQPSYDEPSLVAAVRDADVLVTRYHNPVTRRVLESAPALRAVVQGTSGLDNIDLEAARVLGIEVIGIPGENANAVAEIVVGTMIVLTRTLPAYDRMVRSGRWQRDDCARRRELRSHRIGIIGLGRVGGRLAYLLRGFGCEPRAYDPYLPEAIVRERGAEKIDSLDVLLRESDIVTLHVPLTDETRRMIDERALALLPPGAIVINSCRGAVVDLDALLARLAAGALGGVALDVYEDEPPSRVAWPDDPRLLLTPHIAGCSRESKASIGRLLYARTCEACGVDPLG